LCGLIEQKHDNDDDDEELNENGASPERLVMTVTFSF
jgi:hypothetical protein